MQDNPSKQQSQGFEPQYCSTGVRLWSCQRAAAKAARCITTHCDRHAGKAQQSSSREEIWEMSGFGLHSDLLGSTTSWLRCHWSRKKLQIQIGYCDFRGHWKDTAADAAAPKEISVEIAALRLRDVVGSAVAVETRIWCEELGLFDWSVE